ncbi:SLC45 family MFS transporter [Rothia terrae]|uniref:SLC45 family MFS transporter n=1 Tax=Rothia terrae TaxID=396015 RepID=UPI001444F97C|nr:SLC45 family MFS transporter [Rothia terrae]NKZ34814.1 SLC45 family MFS transporter [Rothia terrae]
MTFGFFGVNMAFSLQGANMSRIAQTLGADPNQLGFFFVSPPLMGMVVQPILGRMSDKTWMGRFGRRMPYLLIGTPLAAIVTFLLPFSGSFGFGYGSLAALIYMATAVCLMDVFSNIAMAPFRMVLGDTVNDKQKNFAFACQQIFAYAGGILAALLPYVLTQLGVPNTAEKGVVPQSVIWSFMISAVLLVISGLFTALRTKEYDPETYARYHGVDLRAKAEAENVGTLTLFKNAPRAFWELSVVQFFSWIGIMYTWTYATGAMAKNIWGTTDPTSAGYQDAGNWYSVMTAVLSISALIFGILYSRSDAGHRKRWYAFGLFCDVVAIVAVATTQNKWVALAAFVLYGFGNFAINTMPFAILTSSLKGKNVGSYLGLFNIAVCLPQIIGSVAGFFLVPAFGGNLSYMMLFGAVFILIGAVSVYTVREGR